MIRLTRPFGLTALSLFLAASTSSARAQQTPAPAPPAGSVPDQATITKDYQTLESSAATRIPAEPPQAPAPNANANPAPAGSPSANAPTPSLNQSWQSFQAPRRISRTSVNSYSYGYGSYPGPDSSWGFRNPGNVGRSPEYYPPNDQFQNGGPHNYVAQFDQGPYATTRAAQFRAESLGIAKYNAIQGHIDRYGMPRIGFGWGLGFGAFPF